MIQKTNWINFLRVGKGNALIINLLYLLSCAPERVEPTDLYADVIFINETNYKIKFNLSLTYKSSKKFLVKPKSTATIKKVEGNSLDLDIERCCEWVVSNVFSSYGYRNGRLLLRKFIINDTLCVTYHGTGPGDISNYEGKVLGDEHYQFTYRFIDKDFTNLKKCK